MTSFVWNLNEICSFAPLKPDNNKKKINKNLNFIKNSIEKSPIKVLRIGVKDIIMLEV